MRDDDDWTGEIDDWPLPPMARKRLNLMLMQDHVSDDPHPAATLLDRLLSLLIARTEGPNGELLARPCPHWSRDPFEDLECDACSHQTGENAEAQMIDLLLSVATRELWTGWPNAHNHGDAPP
jgi:hypothetical protein